MPNMQVSLAQETMLGEDTSWVPRDEIPADSTRPMSNANLAKIPPKPQPHEFAPAGGHVIFTTSIV